MCIHNSLIQHFHHTIFIFIQFQSNKNPILLARQPCNFSAAANLNKLQCTPSHRKPASFLQCNCHSQSHPVNPLVNLNFTTVALTVSSSVNSVRQKLRVSSQSASQSAICSGIQPVRGSVSQPSSQLNGCQWFHLLYEF